MRALAICLALVGTARADDSWRCGDRLVTVGDSARDVLEKCGAPTKVEKRDVARRPRGMPLRRVVYDCTYDRGPNEFVRVLTFSDGVLRDIEVGDYGR